MGAEPVTRQDHDGLAVLTLDHPPLNLFDAELTESLAGAVRGLATEPARAVLIRAAGKVVSAGVDVNRFAGASSREGTRQMTELLEITHNLEALPCPTVFAAHGLTLTAAFELALACDLVVAASSAQFGLVEATVGLTPGMGGTQRVLRAAGPARARELVMTGDLYPATTLFEWGVVNRVVADEQLADSARELAERLARGPTLAHAVTKRIARAAGEGGTAAADEITPEAVGSLYESEDFQAGVRSLLEQGPGKATFNGN